MSPGFTLVEVLAALGVLAIAMAVTTLALPPRHVSASDALLAELRATRRQAIRTAAAVAWTSGADTVLFRPDGSAAAARIRRDSVVIDVQPLTGAVRASR